MNRNRTNYTGTTTKRNIDQETNRILKELSQEAMTEYDYDLLSTIIEEKVSNSTIAPRIQEDCKIRRQGKREELCSS